METPISPTSREAHDGTGSLTGRAAIVTGGSQGIGFGVASALVIAGADVIITGRTSASLGAARAQLTALRPDATVLDLTADGVNPGSAPRVVERAVDEFGRLDVLVNNAQQVVAQGPIEETTPEAIEASFQSGVFATWRYMSAAYPHLRRTRGTVVNFGSGVAITGMLGFGAYASNKEAIRGLTRVAAREWGPSGVTVNVINPVVRTQQSEAMPADQVEQAIQSFPLRRFGDAQRDVGGLVVFLAGPEGSFMTGGTFDVDGGAFMRP